MLAFEIGNFNFTEFQNLESGYCWHRFWNSSVSSVASNLNFKFITFIIKDLWASHERKIVSYSTFYHLQSLQRKIIFKSFYIIVTLSSYFKIMLFKKQKHLSSTLKFLALFLLLLGRWNTELEDLETCRTFWCAQIRKKNEWTHFFYCTLCIFPKYCLILISSCILLSMLKCLITLK